MHNLVRAGGGNALAIGRPVYGSDILPMAAVGKAYLSVLPGGFLNKDDVILALWLVERPARTSEIPAIGSGGNDLFCAGMAIGKKTRASEKGQGSSTMGAEDTLAVSRPDQCI